MTRPAEIAPLFTDLTLSADDANAIVAALRDVAQSDGEHEEEVDMIAGFVALLDADLGNESATSLPEMTPEKLASTITDEKVRTVAIQCAVLLAWADGAYSDKERARVVEYASALGFSREAYDGIETAITSWVQSGDLKPLFV
jgi:tellurite resistance protein